MVAVAIDDRDAIFDIIEPDNPQAAIDSDERISARAGKACGISPKAAGRAGLPARAGC